MDKTKYDPYKTINKVKKVASLPEIYVKIDNTLKNPVATTKDLVKIIEGDPTLTSKLLRIANSAFYGFTAKVETVNHAITILGTQQLRELALACSTIKLFKDIPAQYMSMESFWRHSIACGCYARAIATMRHESNVERFFVLGLLHDIGRLILITEYPTEAQQLFETTQKQENFLHESEKEIFGYDHALLGSLLLKSWKLSDRLCEAIMYHHAPEKAQLFPIDTAIAHVADVISNALAMGSAGELLVPKLIDHSWNLLNLKPDSLEIIMQSANEQYEDAVNFILHS